MVIREWVEERLGATFQPIFLEVMDESYRHNAPTGSEGHSKVILISDRFTGEYLPDRYQAIYSTLTEEFSTTAHVLTPYTYTIKGWEGLQDTVFASPLCRGVGSIA